MANLKTDSINSLNGFVSAEHLDNFGTAGIIISGTWTGIITFQGSLDGINYVNIFAQSLGVGFLITSTTSNGQFLINTAGLRSIRVIMTSYTSGTADVVIQANAAIAINRSLSTIFGATDGTSIGNTGDRLKTDSSVVITSGSPQYYLSNNQMFCAAININMISAGTENPLVLFRNPPGSGKNIYFVSISGGSTANNAQANFILWGNPTVTSNGATLTNFQRNVGNTPANATALTTYSPTVSAYGNMLAAYHTGQNSSSVIFAENFSLGIQPNNSVLLTGDPKSNNREASITFVWVEVPI